MPKARDPNRDKAFKIYQQHGGKIDLVEIASQLNFPPGTIRGWKSKDKWDQWLNGTLQKNTERSKRKRGGQPGNKNAVGNDGGAPLRNDNAVKHGLFEKYLPQETLDIVNNMSLTTIDILWDQIQIAYAAIVRAQHIMYVRDKDDTTKELKRQKESTSENSSSWEKEYELQFAWDKQASYMQAQARAQGELRSMIKQYSELCKSELATDEQKARLALIKAQTAKLSGTDNQGELKKLDEVLAEIKGVI